MNHPLGTGPIQTLGSQAKLRFGLGDVTTLHGQPDFLDLGADGRLQGTVSLPPDDVLT
jgi:hypothetical protein